MICLERSEVSLLWEKQAECSSRLWIRQVIFLQERIKHRTVSLLILIFFSKQISNDAMGKKTLKQSSTYQFVSSQSFFTRVRRKDFIETKIYSNSAQLSSLHCRRTTSNICVQCSRSMHFNCFLQNLWQKSFIKGKFYHGDTKTTKYQRNIEEVQRFEMKFSAFEEKWFVGRELNLFIVESIKFF